jgi:neopullulanase
LVTFFATHLASGRRFLYSLQVKFPSIFRRLRENAGTLRLLLKWLAVCAVLPIPTMPPVFAQAASQQADSTNPNAPVVTKIEPPSWWINFTPEVMLLISGRNLEVTHSQCNLRTVIAERTQSSLSGQYLFMWLKIAPETKSGTAVCHLTTPNGTVSIELPLASRAARLGRNEGLSPQDVMYLIMPDRFANGDPSNDAPPDAPGTYDRSQARAYHGGDLRGIRDHLSYLKDLGVTTLLLTPVVKNGAAQDYHGYGAVDLYAVDPHLGNLAEYQSLVVEAHKLEMKVFFDFVANHVGPHHPWVANPPLRDWFHGTPQQHENSSEVVPREFYGWSAQQPVENGSFDALADPHAPPRMSRFVTDGWFFNVLPDLNTDNPVVADYLLQNALWWAETSGLDGYRLDTFPYVSRKFWAYWHRGIRQAYPQLTTIGEVFHRDPAVTSFFDGGQRRFDGMDSGVSTVFDFPLFFTLRDVLLEQAPAGRLADILRQDGLYAHPDSLVTFFGNHDVSRFAGAPGSSVARLKLAFALALTLRGIPEFYYGDEIGMPGANDPDNRRDFPGGWPGDLHNAFTAEGRTKEQQEVFSYARALLHLRGEHTALQSGPLWHLLSNDNAYVFLRESDEERILVAFNNSMQPADLHVPLQDTPARGAAGLTPLFGQATAKIAGSEAVLALPPQSVSIFLLD